MIELPLLLTAGILGSSHCIGMCGPFALTIGSNAPTWRQNLARQLVYSVGRIFTYSVLGAIAGFCAYRLSAYSVGLLNVASALAIVAGLFLIYEGLRAAGWIRRRSLATHQGPCLGGTFLATFLNSPNFGGYFLAGVFTGFLPCGLVYGVLAFAATTQDVWWGAIAMATFGVGTVPVMVATGGAGSLISLATRRRLFRVAAYCLIATGAISVARGAGFVEIPGWVEPTGCPMCESAEEASATVGVQNSAEKQLDLER